MSQTWFLSIAVGRYAAWNNLRAPVPDSKALEQTLVANYNVTKSLSLHDQDATCAAIHKVFRERLASANENDSLIVHFAGHGYTDPVSGAGYWVPTDGGSDKVVKERWFANEELRGYLLKLPFRHILVLVDACFAGDLLDVRRDLRSAAHEVPGYLEHADRYVSREVLASGGSHPVADAGLGGHSPFCHYVLEALRRNDRPWIDALDVYDWVKRGVSGQQPLYGTLACSGHQRGGHLILRRSGGAPAASDRRNEHSADHHADAARTAPASPPKLTARPAREREKPPGEPRPARWTWPWSALGTGRRLPGPIPRLDVISTCILSFTAAAVLAGLLAYRMRPIARLARFLPVVAACSAIAGAGVLAGLRQARWRFPLRLALTYWLAFTALPCLAGYLCRCAGCGVATSLEVTLASLPILVSVGALWVVRVDRRTFMELSLWPRLGCAGVLVLGRLIRAGGVLPGDLVILNPSYVSLTAAAVYNLMWLAIAGALTGLFCGLGLAGPPERAQGGRKRL